MKKRNFPGLIILVITVFGCTIDNEGLTEAQKEKAFKLINYVSEAGRLGTEQNPQATRPALSRTKADDTLSLLINTTISGNLGGTGTFEGSYKQDSSGFNFIFSITYDNFGNFFYNRGFFIPVTFNGGPITVTAAENTAVTESDILIHREGSIDGRPINITALNESGNVTYDNVHYVMDITIITSGNSRTTKYSCSMGGRITVNGETLSLDNEIFSETSTLTQTTTFTQTTPTL
jgi:hypothetical protein